MRGIMRGDGFREIEELGGMLKVTVINSTVEYYAQLRYPLFSAVPPCKVHHIVLYFS